MNCFEFLQKCQFLRKLLETSHISRPRSINEFDIAPTAIAAIQELTFSPILFEPHSNCFVGLLLYLCIVTRDAEGLQTMRTLGNNMAWVLKSLKAGGQPIPHKEPGIMTNFVR